jgi:hypothetical protein
VLVPQFHVQGLQLFHQRNESAAGLKGPLHCACATVKFRACSCEAAHTYFWRRRRTFLFTDGRVDGSARARLEPGPDATVSTAGVLYCLRMRTLAAGLQMIVFVAVLVHALLDQLPQSLKQQSDGERGRCHT